MAPFAPRFVDHGVPVGAMLILARLSNGRGD